jgi:hypothetical protein
MVKIQEVMEGVAKWFEAKHGLCNEGLDIRKNLRVLMLPYQIVRCCGARKESTMVSSMKVVVMQG